MTSPQLLPWDNKREPVCFTYSSLPIGGSAFGLAVLAQTPVIVGASPAESAAPSLRTRGSARLSPGRALCRRVYQGKV